MSNIDKRAQKELYAKVEQQAHSLRGSPREYQAVTGMCPVNVIEMQAQKIQVLLDELEAAESGFPPLTVERLMREKDALEKRVVELVDWQAKRIAELERNEIREEGNQFLVVRHPGKLPVVKHCAGELEGFLRQLLQHDPMSTIDIVTHRYYGVGGQWVQDADEYLQMMASAAGKGEAS